MRTREELSEDYIRSHDLAGSVDRCTLITTQFVLEVLLDIRDLISKTK